MLHNRTEDNFSEQLNDLKFSFETELLKLHSKLEVLEGELEVAQKEIKQLNVIIEELNNKIQTPKQIFDTRWLDCAEIGSRDAVSFFLQSGTSPLACNKEGKNALHLCVSNNDADRSCEVATLLLKNKAELFYMPDNEGLLPIQLAAKLGIVGSMEYLYEFGRLTENQTLFDKVYDVATVNVKDYLVTRKLLEASKREIKTAEEETQAEGDIEGVKDALSKGANVNARGSSIGDTALLNAVYYKYKAMIICLLQAGADPTMRDRNDDSALDFVIDSKYPRNLAFKPLIVPSFLLFAAQHGSVSDIKKALGAGADLLTADAEGKTALHKVVFSGNKEAIDFLLQKYAEAKIDIAIKDKSGKTPVDYLKKEVKITESLIPLKYYIYQKFGEYYTNAKQQEQIASQRMPLLSESQNSFIASVGKVSNQATGTLNSEQLLSTSNNETRELSLSSSGEWISASEGLEKSNKF